jgi:chromosome segregation ATPase
MSLADNIAEQFVEAISRFTPEYIEKMARAKAEGLKLTDPEQKKRDEYNATINAASLRLDEVKKASDRHDLKRAELDSFSKQLDERKKLLDAREQRHSEVVSAFNIKQTEVASKEKKLSGWQEQLEATAKTHVSTEERLKAWESDLNEQAASFEQAQKLIKRK